MVPYPLCSCLFSCLLLSSNLKSLPLSHRAEGSSKVQSRIEQQQQQMRNATKVPNNVKSSPSKEKTFPSSPMDDIERGKLHWHTSFRNFAVKKQLVFKMFLRV